MKTSFGGSPLKEGCSLLDPSTMVHNDGLRFPWKSVWQTKVPLRAAFFAWSVALEKILTMDNLWK